MLPKARWGAYENAAPGRLPRPRGRARQVGPACPLLPNWSLLPSCTTGRRLSRSRASRSVSAGRALTERVLSVVGLERGISAVGDKDGASDEAGGVAGEEDDGGGQFLDGAVSLQGGIVDPVAPVLRLVDR
jgi:hypothetical protein